MTLCMYVCVLYAHYQLLPLFPLISCMNHANHRQCVLINNPELVKVLSRLAKDIPHTLHDASLLHAACRSVFIM